MPAKYTKLLGAMSKFQDGDVELLGIACHALEVAPIGLTPVNWGRVMDCLKRMREACIDVKDSGLKVTVLGSIQECARDD